ncbi:MAG: Ribosome maturation factor RimM [Sodalis sp.]|uniref:ribosome maturation factor RimM n=1 Tax=Sodalis sp. (in: enterobacteria) TaxID=1898979 RepID=UPI003872D4EA|nr:MAG: Ribosome maturation factor RimM [Sodalis sp.]
MNKQLRIAAPVKPVVVGKMGSAYGIRGCLRALSSTEEAEGIFNYQPWFIKKADEWQPIGLESWKRRNQDLIIKVRDIEDREAATLLTNCEIVIDMSQLPDLNSSEYYWKDLLGCQVVTIDGYQLGEVINLMETGSNDVMVVKVNLKDAFGIQERLIPFLDGQVIKNVDLTAHAIEVDWDPGF